MFLVWSPFTDLTDNLVLEKTVCDLRKELDQSHERERSLQSKTEELETLPVKVDELLGQVRETSITVSILLLHG